MPRSLVLSLLLLVLAKTVFAQTASAALPPTSPFSVEPHNNVTIEWWYLNAHLHTSSGRNLALIGSFFRFGNAKGMVAKDSSIKAQQSHYLIYAITDIDTKKHFAYSYGDRNTLSLLQQAVTFGLEANPDNVRLQRLETVLDQGSFPPPTHVIVGTCHVDASPFSARYGAENSVGAVPGQNNTFLLKLGGSPRDVKVALTFSGLKPPMLVNGDGNTGLRVRTDMKYMSLTRTSVIGTVDTGQGPEQATGEGWFDHQWGDSWTTQSAGWDWWGVQLNNGTDILFFRQLNLKTGQRFFPCATFEDRAGNQVTTHNIVFQYDATSLWKSTLTGVTYPLNWTVTFPDQHTTLQISPDMDDQEMPVLANGGAIWEGSCSVAANVMGTPTDGVAYMELVGYNSAAVKAGLGGEEAK